ncbi:MAG: hypothetical protein QXU47_06885 [Candidatus Bathyarchaeia archaeon]
MTIGPGNSAYYPIFSTLAAFFTLILGVDPLKASCILPFFVNIFMLLCVVLFVENLMPNVKMKNLVAPAAMLIFATAPAMVYVGICFYHRILALAFFYLILYFLYKYLTTNSSVKLVCMIIFLILFLSLLHSSIPAECSIIMFTFTLVAYLMHKQMFIERVKLNSLLRLSTLHFIAFFMYNFMVFITSPVTKGIPVIFNTILRNLIYPEYGSKVESIFSTVSVMPEAVVPVPWIYLPRIRAFLLDLSLPAVSVFMLYKLVRKRLSRGELYPLLFIFSFSPYMMLRLLTWSHVFIFRVLLFPIIAYSFCLFFSLSLESKRRLLKWVAVAVTIFIVFVSFLSPWESYFPRQFYDPSISYNEADFPSPSYIHLKAFISIHPFGEGVILSDLAELLTMILPLEKLGNIGRLEDHYGKPHSYILEFVELKVGASTGDIWAQGLKAIAERRVAIKEKVCYDYDRVFDAQTYRIYFNP